MAIRVKKKRLTIGEDVQEVYAEGAMKALKHVFDTVNTSPRRAAAKYMQQNRGDIARLNAVAKRVREPGQGLDLAVTKMRNMEYHRLEVFEVKETKFLAAQTKNLVIEVRNDRLQADMIERCVITGYVDLGDYNIYIPVDALATPNIDAIHFVPVNHRTVCDRHYHHTATRPSKSFDHPTEMIPSTCWSDFAEPVMTALQMCDIPELFKLLRIFIGRYYGGSPLAYPDWARSIEA